MSKTGEQLQAALKEFGFTDFLPGQKEAISACLAGNDVVTILPTGGGKSLIYQLSAKLLSHMTLVISPLIALMSDQVDSLEQRGESVGLINSHKTDTQISEQLQAVEQGESKILFITPERLDNADFTAWLKKQKVSLLVIDEAHCVSEWGHDFRPSYQHIGEAAQKFGRPPTLALTATATQFVIQDIIEKLLLRDPRIIVHGVDRPNLFFEVTTVLEEREDKDVLKELLDCNEVEYPKNLRSKMKHALKGSGIIYTATTKAAQETALWLQKWGITSDFYHGQRKKADRERVQADFMSGKLQVIVATNAFGMGVDKPDIRFVIHRDVPASLEAYFQEAGRAGRDGDFALCILIYRQGDLGRAAFLAASSDEERKEIERSRFAMMQTYAETKECRRKNLLQYFGEKLEQERCDFCDNDVKTPDVVEVMAPKESVKTPFSEGESVKHNLWGTGTVQSIDDATMMVLFEKAGHKTLDTATVLENDMLQKLRNR